MPKDVIEFVSGFASSIVPLSDQVGDEMQPVMHDFIRDAVKPWGGIFSSKDDSSDSLVAWRWFAW